MNTTIIRRFGWIFFYLIFIGGIVGCSFLPNYPQENAEESVDSILENLAVLATQTQQAREDLQEQLSQTQTSEENQDLGSPTPTGPSSGIAPTVRDTISEENLLTTINTEIKFKPGGTVAHIKNEISKGEKHIYTVGAAAGQTMLLSVSSDHQAVYLGLKSEDGEVLLPVTEQSTDTVVVLPSTQNYQVTVVGGQTSTIYFLTVEIPVDLVLGPGVNKILDGFVEVWDISNSGIMTRVRYLVHGEKGQRLLLNLESPNIDDVNLGCIGQSDGQVYLQYEVKGVEAELELENTQGYYIDVYSSSGVSAAYTLILELR